jgi:hypothetical protein
LSETQDDVAARVAARRERFRGAVSKLSARAQSTELLRLLLIPGAFLVLAGFVLMFLGWYGAAHTARQIEQIPYLISGGFIGLGLVFLGALTLASALWMSILQRFSEASDERGRTHARNEEVDEPPVPAPRPPTRPRRTRSRRP